MHAQVMEAKNRPDQVLFQKAMIQSGAMGGLGPISMEQANQTWDRMCKHLKVDSMNEEERMGAMLETDAATLVKMGIDLKWQLIPLVVDNETLEETEGGELRFSLGLDQGFNLEDGTPAEPLHTLIGDCDAEVSHMHG